MRPSAALLAVLLASAAGPVSLGAAEKTFSYGRGKDSVTLDPADATDGESAKVTINIFDTLVQYKDGSTEVEPALAESWESTDGLCWTFKLRQGVKFHDGTPVDAQAVVFSFERQMKKDHPAHTGEFVYWGAMFQSVINVQAKDERTVEFHLRERYAPFLSNLAMFSAAIVSPAAFAKHGKAFAQNPVGSGPFVFERWERDSRISLKANPNYWGGKPKIDRLTIQVVPDNTTRFLRLKEGGLQAIDGVSPHHVEQIRKDENLRLLEQPGMNVAYLAFHNAKPPFTDARARQAVRLAIDRKAMAKQLFLGMAVPAANPLPPVLWGHNDKIPIEAPDIEKAKGLLKEAGVAAGTKVSLWVFSNPRPYMPEPKKVATYLKSCLKEIGLDCTIVEKDWAEHLSRTQQGEHQMCLLGWTGDNGDPDNFLYVLLDKDNARPPASNVSYYKGEEAHALMLEAQQTSDPARRSELYRKAQEAIYRDCPMVPLVHATQIAACRKTVTGFALHPTGEVRFLKVDVR